MRRDEVSTALMTEIGALEYMKQPLLMAIERVREASYVADEVEAARHLSAEKREEAIKMITQSWRDVHSGLHEMREGVLGVARNLDEICAFIEKQFVSDDEVDGPESPEAT